MRKILLLLLAGWSLSALPQITIDRDVISVTGDYYNSGSLIITSSIGEVMIETWEQGSLILTQGFHQSDLLVTPLNRDVTHEAGITTFTVFAPEATPWTVACNQDWCLVAGEGLGVGTITATYSGNVSSSQRIAYLSVTIGEMSPITVSVTQSGIPFITVYPASHSAGPEAGNRSFLVSSNVNWIVHANYNWIAVSPTSGSKNGTFRMDYTENLLLDPRFATITLTTVPEGATAQISVSQAGAEPFLEVDLQALLVSTEAGQLAIALSSNLDWTVSESAEWLSVTPSSGSYNDSLTVSYNENIFAFERSTQILINSITTNHQVIITVTQAGALPYLSVDPLSLNVGAAAGTAQFNIQSNTSWVASENADWLELTPDAGYLNGTVTVTFTENPLAFSRSTIITIATGAGKESIQVAVNQAGATPQLSVDPIVRDVDSGSGTTSFAVSSNTNWTASKNADWLVISPVSGSLNGTITATFTANPFAAPRSAEIIVTAEGVHPAPVLTINQAGATPELSVNPDILNIGSDAGSGSFEVISNTSWTVTENADWFTVTPANGLYNGTVNIIFESNLFPIVRTENITITSGVGNLEKTVTVTQDAASAVLVVAPQEINIGSYAGSTTFEIASNTSWIVSENADWFTVTPESGLYNGTATIIFEANLYPIVRTATITVTSGVGNVEKTVTVTQAGALPYLTVYPLLLEVGAAAGTAQFNIQSNTSWAATESADWLELTPDAGYLNGTVSVTFTENPLAFSRSTIITIATGAGKESIQVLVYQAGAQPLLSVDPIVQDVDSGSGTTTFAVSSNTNWTVSENADWLVIELTSGSLNGTITATFTANPYASPRSAEIFVTAEGGNPARVLTINQEGSAPELSVNPEVLNVGSDTGSTTFEITSNTSWIVSENADWFTVTPESGLYNGMVNIIFEANPFPIVRTATITVTSGVGNLEKTVTVTQAGAAPELSVNPEVLNVGSDAGTAQFNIQSNTSWVATESADWLNLTPDAGYLNGTVSVTFTENPLAFSRSTIITIATGAGKESIQVLVYQAGAQPLLSVNPIVQDVESGLGTTSFAVSSNTNWTASKNADWLVISPVSGSLNGTITATFTANPFAAPRSAEIFVTAEGVHPAPVLTINQTGASPELSVNPDVLNVGSDAGTTTIEITSNTSWIVSENAEWFTVTPENGLYNGTATIIFEANPFPIVRSATITVTSGVGNLEKTVTVTQAGALPNLTVYPSLLEVGAAAGTAQFNIQSNTSWVASENADWLELNPDAGYLNGTVSVNFAENSLAFPRSTIITIATGAGKESIQVAVNQAGATPHLNVDPVVRDVDSGSGTTSFAVSSNTNWTASENADWLVISPVSGSLNGTITATFTTNPYASPRSAEIIVTAEGVHPAPILTINQTGAAPELSVNPDFLNIGSDAGSGSFEVTSNTSWTITENANWFTVTPANGLYNGTVSIIFEVNPFPIVRTANITVTSGVGNLEKTVTVTQDAASVELVVAPQEINIGSYAGSTTFEIASNTSWIVSENADWFTVTPENGLYNATVTIIFYENLYPIERIATVTVASVVGNLEKTITITQAGALPFITVNPLIIEVNAVAGNTYIDIQSNISWTVSDNANWLVITPQNGSHNGTLTASFTANTGGLQRNALITFSGAGVQDVVVTLTQAADPNLIMVSLPELIAPGAATIEVPVIVSNVSGFNIIASQFTIQFDPAVLVPAAPYVVLSGTLAGNAGWTFDKNPDIPGKIIIGAIGSNPISGSGTMLKVVFNVIGGPGATSALTFSNFSFNAGFPPVHLTHGSLLVSPKFCGDADENGIVMAYDAALTLKHSIGLITLTPQGAVNADVDENNSISAFDAALILRHSIWLPMLPGINTCFSAGRTIPGSLDYDFRFNAMLRNIEKYPGFINADVLFSGIVRPQTVFSLSMELCSPDVILINTDFIDLPPGYVYFTNQINPGTYKIAIINPSGMLLQDLKLRISMLNYSENSVLSVSNIMINDQNFPGIQLSGFSVPGITNANQMLTAYPNPFRNSTTIAYEVMNTSVVQIQVLDLFGRQVNVLHNGMSEQGFYNVVWDGKNDSGSLMPQGWYIISLRTQEYSHQIRVSLIY